MSRGDFPSWEDTPEGFQHWLRWIDLGTASWLFEGLRLAVSVVRR